ncbi:Acyl-CoA thioester hydrolase/bile acid-CoA amino acid N-acetyltransferase [Trinorchestia longiramus]|nr:Acyl-CoA thioester hydrolase/bile acid-CoA amino acid N-acetyltransferase [Trinorchestia longiramus]
MWHRVLGAWQVLSGTAKSPLLRSVVNFTTCRVQSMCSPASIAVTPSPCLMDEPVKVLISGLQGNEVYTLQSSITDCRDVPFTAVAHYRSDDKGVIDLTRMPAIGGHFTGVFPMGLFAAILPVSNKLKDPRFSFRDVTKPQSFELSVFEGPLAYHLLLVDAESLGLEPVCTTVHRRHLIGHGCRRIPVQHDLVRGVVHLPAGSGPFPGVVDLFGSAGGIMEHRSALLAARGVAALSLPFFNYQDLPPTYDQINMEYFKEAVDYLLTFDEVLKEGVGAIGSSKGGDIVLDMALAIPEIKVAVLVNSPCFNFDAPMHVGGKPLRPAVPFDWSKIKVLRDSRVDCFDFLPSDLLPENVIPVEHIPAHMLWVAGLDDRNLKSEKYAGVALQRYAQHNPQSLDKFQILKYPGAGHLIEPPYVPFCEVSYHNALSGSLVWGGNSVDHTNAQTVLAVACVEQTVLPVACVEQTVLAVACVEQTVLAVACVEQTVLAVACVEQTVLAVACVEQTVLAVACVEQTPVHQQSLESGAALHQRA